MSILPTIKIKLFFIEKKSKAFYVLISIAPLYTYTHASNSVCVYSFLSHRIYTKEKAPRTQKKSLDVCIRRRR